MNEKNELDTDPGDKITVSLGHKKGLPQYSSIDFHAGVSVTKRENETEDEAWKRAWGIVERELDSAVSKAEKLLKGE